MKILDPIPSGFIVYRRLQFRFFDAKRLKINILKNILSSGLIAFGNLKKIFGDIEKENIFGTTFDIRKIRMNSLPSPIRLGFQSAIVYLFINCKSSFMQQTDVLQAIDKLMEELSSKTMEYSACVKRDDIFEIKKGIRIQLKEIEKQISALKYQLTILNDPPISGVNEESGFAAHRPGNSNFSSIQ